MTATKPADRPARCEVCRAPLRERPAPRRRRCVDHLDQLALIPLTSVRTARRKGGRR